MRAEDHRAAEGANLVVVRLRLGDMDEEIHPVAVAVDHAEEVHQPRLRAAPLHHAEDVEDAYRLFRRLYHPLRPFPVNDDPHVKRESRSSCDGVSG